MWHKSSYSGAVSDCVEYGVLDDAIAVRDSKSPHGPALLIPDAVWGMFTEAVADEQL
jgi:Domain of unknown function (DUF397)